MGPGIAGATGTHRLQDSQTHELYCRFFPEATEFEAKEFVDAHAVETMAEFQGLLLALEQETEPAETMPPIRS